MPATGTVTYGDGVDRFALEDLLARRATADRPYLEFLRVPDVRRPVRAARRRNGWSTAHTEDEVYVVMAGRSRFTAGDETRDVGPGDSLYVAAGVPHRFHDITAELQLLVVALPEDSRAGG